ncbi:MULTISPECIES: efflux RND transporter periplasmic adaptor subunit [unclassified Mesorhizobium]|uniref:efflux RND transporter periplasmic adaptor subunit n=1 Tax=unclassified Mesorhizobium TaxID=325217 RepID=UPI000FD8CD66|nr:MULTISPECIES: efflux RND transporter periplasmic adaptor subunit [unclassified Mesorhizobium]TGQ31483.1 efflux RND transporter periplasmic adaptor subunit [Mesorhizobium sp. M00.F.Ca.ET.216.01.1.1]TIS87853.1 MAG: efflux RND transporter periplasmic adaptor subunit [Mesorhizobium sp.]
MRTLLLFAALAASSPALAGTLTLAPATITEWKAVYGRVEARNTIPARARIGGVIVDLVVTEGEMVKAGQKIATVQDDKIAFQIAALNAQLRALQAQLETAGSELARGQTLVDKGVITVQRLDQLRTEVDVARNQLAATEAQRSVVVQQGAEGDVFAPGDGRVLTVPVTRGAVIMAGEVVASIGSGGVFLRLAVPERLAVMLEEGAAIRINASGKDAAGRLAKIYPQIDNGRVIADVEVDDLDTDFIDARVLVELPVAERSALLVPSSAVVTRSGIDFIRTVAAGVEAERAVVLGERMTRTDGDYVEILTGLAPGDVVITP